MIVLDLQKRPEQFSNTDQVQISQILSAGQVIVYPTDTLYGLGVDASSEQAVARLYQLKARDNSPVSVLLESVDQLLALATDLNPQAQTLIRSFLPGALTVICKSHYAFASQLVSERGTIGIRIPGDSVSPQIPALYGKPITTTSVNPAGLPPATSLAEVVQYYDDQVALMMNVGVMSPSKGSTVVDLTTTPFKILREGEISRQALQEFLN